MYSNYSLVSLRLGFLLFEIGWFLLFYTSVLYAISLVVFGRAFGLSIESIEVFSGPIRNQLQLFGMTLIMRRIPRGSRVTFKKVGTPQRPGDTEHLVSKDVTTLPLWQQLLLIQCGVIALIGFAAIHMGVPTALRETLLGFVQLYQGLLAPKAFALVAIDNLYQLSQVSFVDALALFATKVAAFNLIPAVGSAGYTTLLILYRRWRAWWGTPVAADFGYRLSIQ